MLTPARCPLYCRPVVDSDDPYAWREGHPAELARWTRTASHIDAASIHALLRASGLPRPELTRMGWSAKMLDGRQATMRIHEVQPRLGAIVIDWYAWHTDRSPLPSGERVDPEQELGHRVIEAHFTCPN